MHTRLHNQDNSSTSAQNTPLQARPFTDESEQVTELASEQNTPSLQARLENSSRSGHNFGNIPIFSPTPKPAIQAKLTVGEANDQYEQEADRVAEQVMAMPAPTAQPIQRQTAEEEELQMKPLASSITPLIQRETIPEEEEELQMKSADAPALQREAIPEEEEELQMKPEVQRSAEDGLQTGDDLETRLNQSQGNGNPLSDDVRAFMEPRFGTDFSGVRVHTDGNAVQMNRDLNAQAFAHKQDIYFASGKYDPSSHTGKELLAHELTHVVQQTGAVQSKIQRRSTTVSAPFIGGSPFNDSSVTFTPRGAAWVGGVETSSSDFPEGANGTVQIRAGTRGTVQLHVGTSVFEDNLLINQSWNQSFYVSWGVSADRRGNLTIDQTPMATVNPRDGSVSQSSLQSINASQGSNYVMVNPIVQGPSGTGGISVGVGVETNYPGSFVQRPFRLNVEVTDIQPPEGEVTIGPIKMLRNHEVLFERPGQRRVSTAQEGQLISWYNGLSQAAKDQIEAGAEPVSLEGHASTTGDPAKNRELSNDRMEAVRRILSQFAGNRASFNYRSVGEYQAATGDNVEAAEERKVVISVWEQISEGETPPGGSSAGSAGSVPASP